MTYSYILHPEAQKEYEESIEWYLSKSVRTASRFVKAIETAFSLICSDPYIWSSKYKNYREYHLKKFPFTIIYRIDSPNELVVIIAVYHQKRIPEKKYR